MSKISYVSGHLHRISDQLAAAEKKEYQNAPVPETETERIIPEPEPHIRARYDEMMRLRRDMIARLTEHTCRFSSEMEMLDQRREVLGKASGELEAMLAKIEKEPVPAFDDPKFKSKLTDMILMLEHIRLDDIRIAARNTASPSAVPHESGSSTNSFSNLSSGELFRKGFFFFLPMMILALIAVLILSAAFVTAWLLAF